MSTTSSTYNFVVSIPANGRSQVEEKARVEKRLGRPVKYLGRVMQAAKASEARRAQASARA